MPFLVEELYKSLIWYHNVPIKIQGFTLYANLIVIRMIDYDIILRIMLVTDTPYGDMMSKEASTLQIIRDEYLIKTSKFDKQAKG